MFVQTLFSSLLSSLLMDTYLLAVQTQECEFAHVVSCHEHLSAYGHIYTAVPVTKRKQRKMWIYWIKKQMKY